MKTKNKEIFVYEVFSSNQSVLMGKLYVNQQHGQQLTSFEYDKAWLNENTNKYFLDPDLMPYIGRQFPSNNNTFGMIADASPDRWGRILINKRERIISDKENRKPNKLYDIDYLLGVDDETRIGGLRFKTDENGDFINSNNEFSVPPWARLRTLEEMARNFESDSSNLNSRWIEQLIRPGSSLGGARPKTTVIDTNRELWIAKFPSKNDTQDIGAWEKVAHDLADLCSINVPAANLSKFSNLGSTFLVKRFDRVKDKRIHIASAMTMLGRSDGDSAAEGVSYLDIADFLKTNGANADSDLRELWKRIVFNMAITNSDDHLRNHSFILKKDGWHLSPMYDVNPTPYGNELSLNVDSSSNEIDLDLAINTSEKFGIEKTAGISIANKMLSVINENWRKIAKKYKISNSEIKEMTPAFRLCENSRN